VYQQMERARVFSNKWYKRGVRRLNKVREVVLRSYRMRSEGVMLQRIELSGRLGRERHRRLKSLFEVFRTPLEGKRVMEDFGELNEGDLSRRTTLVERLDSLAFRDNRRVRRLE